MQDSLESIVLNVGGGLMSPGVGTSELALGLLVGLGFAWSALRSVWPGHHSNERHQPQHHAGVHSD